MSGGTIVLAGALDGDRAAGVEGAAGRQGAGIGGLATDHRSLPQPVGGIRLRDRREQRLRVGVPGLFDQLRGGRQFDDAPGVHDRDAIGEVAGAGEVVRDVQERQLLLRLEVLEQVQDLGAAGGVDHGDRLVGHQVVRPQHHGPGDADALALAARERVRVLLHELAGRGELDLLQRRQHPRLALAAARRPVDDQWLLDQLADTHVRAEAGEGVLEDDLRTLPEGQQLAPVQVHDVRALEDDAAAADGHQVQGGPAQRGLAAA